MELRHLRVFVAAARHASFTKAARELGVTQPAVTQLVSALEDELGEALFERVGRSVRLTPAGDTLLAHAPGLLTRAREAERAVRSVSAGTAGRLSVAAGPDVATYAMPALLSKLREQAPELQVSLMSGSSSMVASLVAEGAADLGIAGASPAAGGTRAIPLCRERLVLVVPKGHSVAKRRRGRKGNARRTELAGETVILCRRGVDLRDYVAQTLCAPEHGRRRTIDADSIEAVKLLVQAGLGISIVPEVAVQRELEAGELAVGRVAGLTKLSRQLWLALREDGHISGPMRTFLGLLKEHFRARLPAGLLR